MFIATSAEAQQICTPSGGAFQCVDQGTTPDSTDSQVFSGSSIIVVGPDVVINSGLSSLRQTGSGDVTITIDEDAELRGIQGIQASAPTNFNVTNNGFIEGRWRGIGNDASPIPIGQWRILNTGTIRGLGPINGGEAVSLQGNGRRTDVYFENAGTLFSRSMDGLYGFGLTGTYINNGDITAGRDGMRLDFRSDSSVLVGEDATVSGGRHGISVNSGWSNLFGFPADEAEHVLDIRGDVYGGSHGIAFGNGNGASQVTIVVSGTVRSGATSPRFGTGSPLPASTIGLGEWDEAMSESHDGVNIVIEASGILEPANGLAIHDYSDPQADFIPQGDGATSVTVRGQVLGDVVLAWGPDIVVIETGAILGDAGMILGSGGIVLDGDNSARLQNGTTWGSAPAFVAGEIDVLRFSGWTGNRGAVSETDISLQDIDIAQLRSFERIELTSLADVTFGSGTTPGNILSSGNPVDRLLFSVEEGAFARFAGDIIIDGDVNNFGALDLSGANINVPMLLTVTGNYTSADGTLSIDSFLGDDTSPSDVLVIGGDTSGSTNVFVNNTGGAGAQTVIGILVVDVEGASDGEFLLANGDYVLPDTGEEAIIAGAYGYALRQSEDGNWYLQSQLIDMTPIWQPGAPIYEALPVALTGLNRVGTLAQRIEGRQMLIGSVNPEHPYGSWIRIEGERLDVTPDVSTSDASFDQSSWRLQAGLDAVVAETGNGFWVAGVNLFTGGGSAEVMSSAGNGLVSTDAFGVGLTATYYGNGGFYADAQLQYTAFESDLSSSVLGALATGVEGEGRLASLEIGQEFTLGNGMTLTPQAQLIWSDLAFKSFTGPNGETVSLGNGDSLQLRLGVAAEQSWDFSNGEEARLYGIANVIHELRGETSVLVDGTELSMSTPEWVGEIGLGGSYDWAGDGGETYSLYGEVSASGELSGGEMRGLSGTVGFRIEF
jgi:outer membrane autotransporter protein